MQTEKNIWLKVLSMILTLALLISCIPNQVYAMAGEALADLLDTTDTAVLQPNATPDPVLSTAQIVAEDESRRGETYKEYIMNNGLRLATVYPSAIHYEQNGQWKDIDNTLVATVSNGKAVYQNAAGAWNVRFPRNLSGSDMIGITKNGHTVQFGMAGELRSTGDLVVASVDVIGSNETVGTLAVNGAQTTVAEIQQIDMTAAREAAEHPETVLEKLNSRITYANVYPSTNVVYDLQGNRLKESVVLQRYDADIWGYRYTLDTGDLVPVLQEDQQIDLCDSETNEPILTMPAPYMLDSNGEVSYDVEVSLTRNSSGYLLSYYLPKAWLAEADRAWPVVLDPIINFSGTYYNVDDITVAENYNEDMGRGVIQCGYYSKAGAMRIYMQFLQLPTMTSADVIVDATIRFNKLANSGTTANVSVHKVTEEWSQSTISWSDQPAFDTNIEDYVVCKPAGHYKWNITDIVRDWYETENYGMVFKVPEEIETAGVDNWKQFYSSEFNLLTNDIPLLTIYYQNSNGLESYWDYASVSAGRAGTGYIQNYSGNLIWVHSDMGFDGNRMPVSISHVYSANDAGSNRFALGNGWRTNYNQTITLKTATDGTPYYVWEDGDGTIHEFFEYCDSVYKDIDDLGLLLTELTSGYVITDKYDNASYFDTYGRLTSQVNNQQTTSRILISYEATNSLRIKEIYDGVDRKYSFSYSNGLLNRIDFYGTGTSSRYHVQYSYTNNNLTAITYRDQKSSLFTYSSKNILLSAADIDGYKITFGYNTMAVNESSRVVSVLETDGGEDGANTTFEYFYRRTQLEDHNGNTQTMFFNEWGNTISIQDSEGKAVFYQFDTDVTENGVKNRLLTASREQRTIINLILDSSFEERNYWPEASGLTECVRVNATSYAGDACLKSTCDTDNGAISATNGFYDVGVGETYTFSAYVRAFTDSGFKLAITDDLGTTVYSDLLNGGNEWTRLEVSYSNKTSASRDITLALYHTTKGTAYIDCVQLEKNSKSSPYNIVYDGDVTESNVWEFVSEENPVFPNANGSTVPNLSDDHFFIQGDVEAAQYVQQTITISGRRGDRYVFGGWTKGDSLPVVDANRFFGFVLIFHNTDNTETMVRVAANPNLGGYGQWQYLVAPAVAEKEYDAITIRAEHSYNSNAVCFDGLQLYKEEFGERYTYDDTGNLIASTDVLGRTTEYEYDAQNNVITIRQPESYITEYSWEDIDGDGDTERIYVPVPCRVVICYTYANHNVTSEIQRVETSTGGLKRIIQNTTYSHDRYGNILMQKTSGKGEATGAATKETYLYYTYTDDANHIKTSTDAVGNVTVYGYDLETSILSWVKYPNDTEDTKTRYSYDTMYRPYITAVVNDQGINMSTAFTYRDDLLTAVATQSTIYRFEYGDFSVRTKVRAGDMTLATYTYTDDKNHYLKTLEYGNKDKVEYTYDDWGRVIQETYYEDGYTTVKWTASYKYDSNGFLTSMYDSGTGTTTQYFYDSAGRSTGYQISGNSTYRGVRYVYGASGQITSTTETNYMDVYTTEFGYNGNGQVRVLSTDDYMELYEYGPNGRLENQYTYHMGSTSADLLIRKEIQYATPHPEQDPQNRQTCNQVSRWNWVYAANYRYYTDFEYDGNGNITAVIEDDYTTTYVYDSANQLIRENNQKAGKTWVWTYDGAGNIKSKKEYAYTTDALGAVLDTILYSYATDAWGDVLTGFDGEALYWDEIGNLSRDANYDYTWTRGRQLARIDGGSVCWHFTYDANGMRTERRGNSNTYLYTYNGSQLSRMSCNGASLRFTYDANGRPLAVFYGGAIYYYVLNLQGDVVAIVDSTGHMVVEYTYDAWGKLLTTTGSMASTLGLHNPLRYRGYVYDRETGLYYLQSRYYNPEIGRFISADAYVSTGQGILGNNMFAYCNNNPVNYTDPTGHSAILIALAIGAVLGGIYGGISAAANDQNIVAGIAIGAVVGGLTGLFTEALSVPYMLLSTFAIGAIGDFASQVILDGKSFGDVNLISVGMTGLANAGLALVGKGLSNIDSMAGLAGAEKVAFGAITNSPLLGMGMALNMIFSQNFGVYTVNDLIDDLSGPKYELAW